MSVGFEYRSVDSLPSDDVQAVSRNEMVVVDVS